MKFERRDCVPLMAFMLLLSASLSAEPKRIEIPERAFNAGIEMLEPYPVTTKCTDVNKVITFFASDGSVYSGAEVGVCQDDGSCYKYKTDKGGQIQVKSSRPVMKIIIFSYGKNGESPEGAHEKTRTASKILDENVLGVYFSETNLPMSVDVSLFPADQYTLICVWRMCGISE